MNRRSFFATLAAPLVARFAAPAMLRRVAPHVEAPSGVSMRWMRRIYDGEHDILVNRMDTMIFYPPIEIRPDSGVDFEFSTADACLNLDELRKMYA